ncbi:hypothetical protein LV779_14000 [Streptomyces thinghirensis]|nr:hypothetical protein [Streptomyces thinghirensis]
MAGARMVANDKLYARTDTDGTQVRGWTDPIRVIDAPGHRKRSATSRPTSPVTPTVSSWTRCR